MYSLQIRLELFTNQKAKKITHSWDLISINNDNSSPQPSDINTASVSEHVRNMLCYLQT